VNGLELYSCGKIVMGGEADQDDPALSYFDETRFEPPSLFIVHGLPHLDCRWSRLQDVSMFRCLKLGNITWGPLSSLC
jgi:hypothetical protein